MLYGVKKDGKIMIIPSTTKYKLLYDNEKILCFIGNSHPNNELFQYFVQTRECENIRYEDMLIKKQSWFDARQFIVTAASIQFRKLVVDGLAQFNPDYFSVYSTLTHIGGDVSIGRGTLISSFNTILDGVVVGGHTLITTHTTLSHLSVVNDFCHIGPYSQILVATVGSGCYLAARSSIVGTKSDPRTVVDYCNFILESMVTKNITSPGTYYGNKRLNSFTSLDKKID